MDWRAFIYYPLGLLPSLFFSARFIIQWIQSEKVGKTVVPALFWRLSLAGNALLALHYFLQFQYLLYLLQIANGVIAWRNLNLMEAKKPLSTRSAIISMVLLLAFGSVCMGFQELFNSHTSSPILLKTTLVWHVVGFLGQALFASRFWIQWWEAERAQKSTLSALFWWLSIVGSLISITYFIQIRDYVSLLNHSFALIPYVRNLVLVRH